MYKYLEFFDIDAVYVGLGEKSLSENKLNIFPNPIRESARIYVNIAEREVVSLSVFNNTGQEITRMADNQAMEAGEHAFEFNAAHLPGGVYFCVLTSGAQKVTRKIVVIK
jgi:hypothetical protein